MSDEEQLELFNLDDVPKIFQMLEALKDLKKELYKHQDKINTFIATFEENKYKSKILEANCADLHKSSLNIVKNVKKVKSIMTGE